LSLPQDQIKMSINPEQTIQFSPMHRLQWEEVQKKHVILYPEGMVELNQSSAEILKLCDGAHTLGQIISELERKFEATSLTDDITTFLEIALKNGWIQQN
jgi:pyrroloquinoline quinone biosynthesis protein D